MSILSGSIHTLHCVWHVCTSFASLTHKSSAFLETIADTCSLVASSRGYCPHEVAFRGLYSLGIEISTSPVSRLTR